MAASIYRSGDYVWVHDVLGNFVCLHDGVLVATIVASAWEPWQIMLHPIPDTEDDPVILPAGYDNPQDAMRAAGQMLGRSGTFPTGVGYLGAAPRGLRR